MQKSIPGSEIRIYPKHFGFLYIRLGDMDLQSLRRHFNKIELKTLIVHILAFGQLFKTVSAQLATQKYFLEKNILEELSTQVDFRVQHF